jgi:hypothetical protein
LPNLLARFQGGGRSFVPELGLLAVSPRARVVPRPLTELDPVTAKLIENVTVDSKGRLIPKL